MNNTDISTAQSRREYTLLTVGFSLRSGVLRTGDARTARAVRSGVLRSGDARSARAVRTRTVCTLWSGDGWTGDARSAQAVPITHSPLSERAHHSKQYAQRTVLTNSTRILCLRRRLWEQICSAVSSDAVALGYCLHGCARSASNVLYKLPRFCFAKLCRMEIYLYKLPRRLAATPLQNLKGIYPLPTCPLVHSFTCPLVLLFAFNFQFSTFN